MMMSKNQQCWLVQLTAALLCLSAALAQCTVDPSVSEEDKPRVESIIKMLQPIYGMKSTFPAGGVRGGNYAVGICVDAVKHFAQPAVVWEKGTTSELIGCRNRTLAVQADDWLEVRFLGSERYSNTTDPPSCRGRTKSARLLLLCDQDVQGESLKLTAVQTLSQDCYTLLTGHHSLACSVAPTPHHSLGGFSILIIILVVCFGSYFVFGFAYLRFIKGAKGIEQIPHRLVWFRVGNTIADCVGTVCRCDKYCGGAVPDADQYRNVDEYSAVGGATGGYASSGGGGASAGGGAGPRGYHDGYVQMPGSNTSTDREELLAPHRNPADADLLQP